MVGRTVAHYRIVAELGAGGMGIVYKAQDIRLERFLALKFLKPERISEDFHRRFLQEARASSALHHPNIVHIYDIGVFEGQDYIAMEFVEGQSLRDILRERRIPPGEAVGYAVQIADAMAAAHAAGIVHRDLKPGNLMITPESLVKILDFGLAKFANQNAPPDPAPQPGAPFDPEATTTSVTITSDRTRVGTAVGSPAYMSPEQAQGKAVDGRSDLFSFGVILYEMLTGRRAFPGEKTPEVISAVMQETPPSPRSLNPEVSAALDAIVMRAIRKNPAQRFQTMQEMKAELAALPESVPPGLLRSRRRTAAIAAAAAILAVAPLAWYVSRTRAPKTVDAPLEAKRLTLDPGLNIDPAISEDGKRIAYASDRSGEGNLDIWVRPVGGAGEPVRLTRDPAEERQPAFSPDGSQIAFRSERSGGGIDIVPASGGEPQRIIPEGRRPRFSPDGTKIAYWKGIADPFPLRPGYGASFVYDLATRQTRQIAADFPAAVDPVWSPDGKHILVIGVKDAANIAGTFNWWVLPVAGGLAVRCPVNNTYLLVPCGWHGDRVFYESGGYQIGSKIGQVRLDSKTFQPVAPPASLTVGTTDEFSPAVSSDGTIVFSAETRNSNLYSLPLDVVAGKQAGAPAPLTRDLGENSARSVSADGKRLVFLSRRPVSEPAQVWAMDLPGGRIRALTSGGRTKHLPEISPDGSTVAWREASTNATEIFLTPYEGGDATKLCGDCQGQPVWMPGGDFVLAAQASQRGAIALIDRSTGKLSTYMRPPHGLELRARAISADGKWLAFAAHRSQSNYTISVAPFAPDRPPAQSEWIEVLSSADAQPYPRWSPDGNLLYFGSTRDGFGCLWAQRLDRRTRRPEGQPFAIQHFHLPTQVMEAPSFNYPFALGARGAVLSLTERAGGLWQLNYGSAM